MSRQAKVEELFLRKYLGPASPTPAAAGPNEISLEEGWTLEPLAFESPLLSRMVRDFREFCGRRHGINFQEKGDRRIRWISSDSSDPPEAFAIAIEPRQILLSASDPRGWLRATQYLRRLLEDRGGPFLEPGKIPRAPALSPRFSESAFVPAIQSPLEPGKFSDEYLGMMSHFGVNALKFYINLYDLWKSESLPELNSANYQAHLKALRALARRLAEFGIDLYLHLNTPPLPRTHPVFSRAGCRGAQVEFFLEEFSGREWHSLCSSNELVHRAYSEVIESIYHEVPELKGAVMIVGGECFFHCFTRPAGPGLTNCPHCAGRDPHEQVATLVNVISRAMRRGDEARRVYAWPYSAFTWSREDASQSKWIEFLEPGVGVLANFDCFDPDLSTGGLVRCYDYNIKLIGPSTVFSAQRDRCRERNLEILAKTETNTTPDTFFLPYLPVHFRWHKRFRAIRESGVRGFMGQWRFYGMNGCIPEELQYHSVWNPERTAEDLLGAIARRDFGLTAPAAIEVVGAWADLSAAWEVFPYSALTSGEREGYMRGPWYLGPAHPLIFNAQNEYRLGPRFFTLRGDIAELASAEEVAALPKKPRYVSDLLICLPFGQDRYLALLEECRGKWEQGVIRLSQAIGENPNPEARLELGICETIAIHLRSLENTVRFHAARETLHQGSLTLEKFEEIMAGLKQIVRDEISNAHGSLPLLAQDPRIGYGYTYGEVYDANMVREKIAQCEFVLHQELDRVGSFLRFHVWQRFP